MIHIFRVSILYIYYFSLICKQNSIINSKYQKKSHWLLWAHYCVIVDRQNLKMSIIGRTLKSLGTSVLLYSTAVISRT